MFVRYYMATLPAQPGVRHLFRTSTESSITTNHTCLTCKNQQKYDFGVSNGTLMPCEYSEVIVSPGFEAYVQVLLLLLIRLFVFISLKLSSTVLVQPFPVLTYSPCLATLSYGPWIGMRDCRSRWGREKHS